MAAVAFGLVSVMVSTLVSLVPIELGANAFATNATALGNGSITMLSQNDTADGWRRVVPGLLKDHRVVALDGPAHGDSPGRTTTSPSVRRPPVCAPRPRAR